MKKYSANQNYMRLYDDLKQHRAVWQPVWKELSAFIAPTRGLFDRDRSQGKRINHKVLLDSSAGLAAEVLSAGMMSGLTTPSRSWFTLTATPCELNHIPEVSSWLNSVKEQLEETFAKSNLYGVLHGFYHEISVFGTAAMLVEEDLVKGIRARLFTAGEYVLGGDESGRINTFGREFFMTAAQLAKTFGAENLPTALAQEASQKSGARTHQIFHLILPNPHYNRNYRDNKHFPFTSVYFLADGTVLRESGYYEFPVIAARWEVKTPSEIYGRGPGWKCLGDVKMLQKMQKTKLVALDKNTNPPMMVSANVQGEVNLLPGGITRYSGTADGAVKPAYQIEPDLKALDEAIENVRALIRAQFFADIFTMLSQQEVARMTAAEVAERREEKMLVLGPVLEHLKSELLDPLIERVFHILDRQGRLPVAPFYLQGAPLRAEYISVIAQAQKAAGTQSVLQGVSLAEQLAQNCPEVLARVDYDRALEEGFEKLGLSYLLKKPAL